MELSCIIVDDEPLAVQLLESFVKRTPYLRFVASYTDPVLALSELSKQPVDLLFLDIQMPDLDGLNLSRMVPPETRVIFATAFKEYAFDSYEVNALDFLLTPCLKAFSITEMKSSGAICTGWGGASNRVSTVVRLLQRSRIRSI